MSDGIKAYYDELEEEAYRARKQKFEDAQPQHFHLITGALDSIERFIHTEPSLTKHQHQLVDSVLVKLRDCFKVKQ